MEQPITYKGVEIIWDIPHEQPDFIVVEPWVLKAMKRTRKMSARRDKRRKHKRHG